jgi:multiple sugar transport system permease protein
MSKVRRRPAARRAALALWHLPRLAVAALFVVPLVWVVSASLRRPNMPPPRTIEWIPEPISWSNYVRIFDLFPLASYIGNSLLVATIAVPATIVTASWAGFAMAQLPQAGRRRLLVFAVMLLMVPSTALWLTRFVIFRYLGLIDTVWALIAPAVMGSSPLYVLLYYWTFRRVPAEVFPAARLDGAGLVETWARIAMPLARPTTVAVAVLSFAFYWSDFVSPLLYLKSESNYTLPVGLQILKQMDATNWPLLMVGAVIITTPVVVLFLLIQRHIWLEGGRPG